MVKSVWTITSLIVTPVLLIIAVFFMGGGHGTYIPAMFLFPWGMVNTIWQDHLTDLSIILSILQYPVYGIFIDKSLRSRKRSSVMLTIGIIIATHMILCALILVANKPEWS